MRPRDIEEQIRTAFAGVECPNVLEEKSDAELFAYRDSLIALRPELFLYVLPRVMVELLRNHTEVDLDDLDTSIFPSLFNVDNTEIVEDEFHARQIQEQLSDPRERAFLERVRADRREAFAEITRDQARAILAWLQEALHWPWPSHDARIIVSDIQGGIDYWSKRATADGSG